MQLNPFITKTILFILLVLPIGCASHKARPYIDDRLLDKPGVDLSRVQTLSFAKVKETICTERLRVTTLKAKADIIITSPEINGEFRCKGVLRFQKSGKIRVIGSKLAKTVFDMLSNGENYWFYLPKEKQARLVPLYEDKDGKITVSRAAISEDANPDYPKTAGTYYSGGAGLSSTVEDYAKFLQMLINGGTYNGVRLLSRKTVELMTTNQLADKLTETFQFSLGFSMETSKNDHIAPLTMGSFSWGGAFSTQYWADPKEKLVALIYLQVAPYTHGEIHNKFKALTYGAFND